MNFTKSDNPCGVPFGLYRIDHDYINALRKREANIIDPEVNDLYCGPVFHGTCERGVFGDYAPVDENFYNSNKLFLTAFCDGVYADFIDFTKMIPVVNERYLTAYTDNEHLTKFCEGGKEELEICGDAAMTAYKEKKPYPLICF